MNRATLAALFIVLVTGSVAVWILREQIPPDYRTYIPFVYDDAPAHSAGEHHDMGVDEAAQGPHGGRLLVDGAFSIEITIVEQGIPPEFRV